MMDTMEKRKKKLELELLRGILGAIEADIDLEHDFSELLEGALIKGRKTVPRQTNVPNGTNPSCQTNVPPSVSERVKKALLDDEYRRLGKPICNPLDWQFLATPKIGDKAYMVAPTTAGLIVVVDEFRGTDMELLMLAQRRLFMYKEEAVRYKMKCEAIIAAMKAQLAD